MEMDLETDLVSMYRARKGAGYTIVGIFMAPMLGV